MRRDMELVRKILLFYERDDAHGLPDGDESVIQHHMALMIEGGLLNGEISETSDGMSVFLNDLRPITWRGHDFIALAREDSTWKRASKQVKTTIGDATVELMSKVLSQMASSILGLPPGA